MGMKSNFFIGITAAVAATVIAPVLVPVIARAGRPLAKSFVKGGLMLFEKGREVVAEAGEMMEDVIAEARAEAMDKDVSVADASDNGNATTQPARHGDGSDSSNSAKSEMNFPAEEKGRAA